MAALVTMPAVIAGDSEASLLSWLVSPGDPVAVGQPLAEIETEKATVELEAEIDGSLSRRLVEAGQSIEVGSALAVIAAAGDSEQDINAVLAGAGVESTGANPAAAGPAPGNVPANSGSAPASAKGTAAGADLDEADRAGIRLFASPLARKMAKNRGVDLRALAGTGPGGRVIRADVERACEAQASAPAAEVPVPAGGIVPTPAPSPVAQPADADYEDLPLSGMRRVIARRLTESKTTIPHFYVSGDVRMDALLELRKQINTQLSARGIKVTVNDLVLKALGKALEATPAANVLWGGDSIRQFRRVDVAVAVATEGGLLTPVVQDVAGRSISSLAAATADYKERAAAGRIRQNELEGGTFSLSNLGMYGVREFSAIINPPHAGILAVGTAEQRAVVVDGSVVPATVMTCTVSADHRAVDGAVAAELLESFRSNIEAPLALLT